MNIYTIWTIVFVLTVLHIVSASMLINHTRSCQDTSRRARDQTYATIILVLSVLSSLSLGILMYNNPPPPGVVNIMAPVRKIFPTK